MRIGTRRTRNHGKGSIGCFVFEGIEMEKSIRVAGLLQHVIQKRHVIVQRRKFDRQITIHLLVGKESECGSISIHYPSRYIALDIPKTDSTADVHTAETPACAHSIAELRSSNVGLGGVLRDGLPSGPDRLVE